jgi:hypothetical protein
MEIADYISLKVFPFVSLFKSNWSRGGAGQLHEDLG